MRTIDRYIIRQFVINFAILTFVIMAFFVLVDLVVNMDEFLEAGRVRAQRWAAAAAQVDPASPDAPQPGRFGVIGGVLWSVGDFYGPMLLLLFVWISGLLVCCAMGFTLAALSRSGELVAMVTSGLSMYRIATPLLLAGSLLVGLALVDQEVLIPQLAPKLARKRAQVVRDAIDTWTVHYVPDSEGSLLSAARFDLKTLTLYDVVIQERDKAGAIVRRITAPEASWREEKQGWQLVEGVALRRDDPTAVDLAPAQPQRAPIDFIATSISPQVLQVRRAETYPEFLSLRELGRLTTNPAADVARVQKIMHKRFSMVVVNVLVLVIGLPFFLLREPTSLLMQAVKAACVCLGAWGAGIMILQMNLAISPVVAAWLPVVFLLPASALHMMTVKT